MGRIETADWGVMGTADWGKMRTADWGLKGNADWEEMRTLDWGVMGTADWGAVGNAYWRAVGTAYWGATAWQRILQQKFQTVHLTVELQLTTRVPAVCDCLKTELSPRMRSHGVMCRVSVQRDKLLLLLLLLL